MSAELLDPRDSLHPESSSGQDLDSADVPAFVPCSLVPDCLVRDGNDRDKLASERSSGANIRMCTGSEHLAL